MAFVDIEISVPAESVALLNVLVKDASNPHEGVTQLINLLKAIQGGAKDASVGVYINASTQSLTASGSSALYNLK